MPRLTISLSERDHLALKLLSIRDNKRLNEVVDDAVKHYLSAIGAYRLSITEKNRDASQAQPSDHDD
jgi:hypothetical protein